MDWHCRYCPFATTCWADELDRLRDGDNAEAIAAAIREAMTDG